MFQPVSGCVKTSRKDEHSDLLLLYTLKIPKLHCAAVRMDMEGAERDDIGVIVHNWPCSMLREEQHAAHTLLHM